MVLLAASALPPSAGSTASGLLFILVLGGVFVAVAVASQRIRAAGNPGRAASFPSPGPQLTGFAWIIADGAIHNLRRQVVGPLAGAHAAVTDPRSRHTLTRVATGVGAFTKKTNATLVIVLADGRAIQHPLSGGKEVTQAQVWAERFNVLAMQATQSYGQGPYGPGQYGPGY